MNFKQLKDFDFKNIDMVKEPSNLMRVGFIKVSSSLAKPMAKEN